MRTLVALTFLVALCSNFNVKAAGNQDFVTGFFLAMRAAEFCPHAFECVSSAASVQKAFADIQAEFKAHASITVVVKAINELVSAFKDATPGCESVASEGKAYVEEVTGIVTKPTFALMAGEHLFKYRTTVSQDMRDYKQSEIEEQYLVAGMKIGEIGRIAIWGTPAE